ncbi:hypothetical protein SAMN05216462_3039 [Xylanibacter ruminicola]|jgi:hypothetical protein|uniref:Uncharacterized protein n=1 Tax=Xylanibacter ruminicola TaxID=839 RepID=A0A1H4F197_XYLRU|nr:hypothetical protein SAMN05216462_3039 [Xylanibacter ruminicola]
MADKIFRISLEQQNNFVGKTVTNEIKKLDGIDLK